MNRFVCLMLLLWLCIVKVQAQSLHFRAVEVEWNNNPLKVKKLLQDREGFIWLGTAAGLFRFDGFEYERFALGADSLPQPAVSALYEDVQQQLWVGFENGKLAKRSNRQLQLFLPLQHKINAPVTAIFKDEKQRLWVATYGEGLFYVQQEKAVQLNTQSGLSDDFVYTLAQGPEGQLWAGTDRGVSVCSFSNNKLQISHLDTRQGLPDNIVTSLHTGTGNSIWIGMQSAGFCRYNTRTKSFEIPEASRDWSGGSITQIVQQGSSIWLGTEGSGIFRFRPEQPEKLEPAGNAEAARIKISSLLPDREGNLWLAGNSSKLLRTNPALLFLHEQNGQKLKPVTAVLAAADGAVWHTSADGIFRSFAENGSKTVWQHFLNQPQFRGLNVLSMYEDRWGFIWLGTFGQGVFRLNPADGTVRQLSVGQGLVNENVLSITGSGSTIWLATLGGVSKCTVSGGEGAAASFRFENFTHQNGLGTNYIYQVFIDSKGRVWFATDGKGLTMLHKGRFTTFGGKDGLGSKTIYSLTEDKNGTIWCSTLRGGLYSYDGSRFRNYGLKEGLRDLNITAVQADAHGNILVLHRQGLDLLDPVQGQVLYWGAEAGVQEPDAGLNVVSKDRSGNIWFGTQNGLICYRSAFAPQQRRPQTRLHDVQVFFRSLLPQHPPVFSHNENHITFRYAGLWFQGADEITYRLKLDGYDREWTSSRNHSITYPNLPPGDYVFNLQASATPDFAHAETVQYKFTVKPPFWNTFWFYAAAFLTALALVYFFVKIREKRLKNAQQLENDKVMFQFETLKSQVNPHFLFNSFNTLISAIEDDPQSAVAYVEKLSDFFRDMLVYREKNLIALREELELVRNYYFLQQKRFGRNLELEVRVPAEKLEKQVAPLTLQLLVENAIKHNIISKEKPLRIGIYVQGGQLVVQNNLQVKKTPEISTKVGLENIRSRYRILSSREIEILETPAFYQVRIPLLKEPEYERIDY